MKQYIVANWKMHGMHAEAQKLASSLSKRASEATSSLPHIVLCPSFPYLMSVAQSIKGSFLEMGAQDCHYEREGAYTGDVSCAQLKDVGCQYVIVGHSERRRDHHESDAVIRHKLEAALKFNLRPLLCIGESAEDRKHGKALDVISHQLNACLPSDFVADSLIIAYEPLWAIGTGLTPTLEQVEEMMGFIKHELSIRLTGGALVPLLYGGSVSALNAPALLDLPHLDGLLVGGASLKVDEFWKIVTSSKR